MVDIIGLWLKVQASRRQKDPRKLIQKRVNDHGAA
jgi:hypothetical protein